MKELELLDTKICNLTASNNEIVRYDGLKAEVEKIIEEKSKGAWVRSRVEFAEKNEKSNAYIFNKAKGCSLSVYLFLLCAEIMA